MPGGFKRDLGRREKEVFVRTMALRMTFKKVADGCISKVTVMEPDHHWEAARYHESDGQ
jgi:hypothetical protein